MKKDIKNIILKSLLYEIDNQEMGELQKWLDQDTSHYQLYDKLKKNNQHTQFDVLLDSIDTDKALLKNKMDIAKSGDKSILLSSTNKYKRLLLISLSSAASILLLFIAFNSPIQNNEQEIISTQQIVQPPKEATIALSTGEIIPLENNSQVNKKIGNSEISINSNKISVKGKKITKGTKNNTLTVPHGKNYNITLSDGTRIWINALSELKFPTEFGETRVVELSGEAFFDVAKDNSRPFIVKMKDYDVVVKGTSFNISNYSDNDISQTTLCSGEVEVLLNGDDAKKFTLYPGNQLSINSKSRQVNIEEVNTEMYTSWRDGYFYFEEQSLDVIFKSLSKWYAIEGVDFESEELQTKRYNGKLLKTDDFANVLKIIEKGTGCMIVRDGRRLHVVKNK